MLFVRLMLYSIAFYSRPEATNDVIVGQMVYWVSEGVCVKFGGSMSNISRDIWAAHFVTDEKRTTPADTGHNIRQNAILALCLKTAQMLHHVKQKLIRGGVISYCVHYCLKMSHNCLQENQQESPPIGEAVGNATPLMPQRLASIILAITCYNAWPCIDSHGRVDYDNNATPAIFLSIA